VKTDLNKVIDLQYIFRTVLNAGEQILKIYNDKNYDVKFKEDKTPLTLADTTSHEIICSSLKSVNDNIPVISEEGFIPDFEERKKLNFYWLVDPLDGTKEFLKRNGEFTVSIALIERNKPVFGIIYAPVRKEIFFAQKDKGSYKLFFNDKTKFSKLNGNFETVLFSCSERLPNFKKSDESINVVISRSHMSQETRDFIDILKTKYRVNIIPVGGSLLKFCLVAEESADIYPRIGSPIYEWDTAAGHIIVEEAGGKVIDLKTGKPLTYNKENLKVPSFIVLGKHMELPI